jgi:hypothetical protein
MFEAEITSDIPEETIGITLTIGSSTGVDGWGVDASMLTS